MKIWKLTFLICLSVGILIIPAECLRADEPPPVRLDLLINEALENNPGIQAAYSQWQAAAYKVKQATSLPDPMLSYAYFGKNVETRVGPQEHKYGISQKIPFPGKLKKKGKIQTKQAQILKEKYEATKREVIKNIKFVYYDIFWIDKAIKITEEEKAILENLEKVARRKYELNLSPGQDVIKAQVELSRLIDKLLLLKSRRESLVAKINSLLDRPKAADLGRTGNVEPGIFSHNLAELKIMAQKSRPELQAASLAVEKAEYEKSLARLDYFPDFRLGFDYISIGSGETTNPRDGQDAWTSMIAVNFPLWQNRLSAQNKEKRASLKAAKKNYENTENGVYYEVANLYYKISAYKDIINLYKTALIPQTEQAFEASRTGYESGKVDFLNWLDSERVLLQTRLAYYKSVVDYQKSIAFLERVVGRDL